MTDRATVEERLREALARQARDTALSAGAWARIEARTVRRRRPPRWVVVPALVTTALVVVAVVNAGDGDGPSRLRVTEAPGRLYLAPSGLDDLRLEYAETDSREALGNRFITRVFGRRASDGVGVPASLVVSISQGDIPLATDGSETLLVAGEALPVRRDGDGVAVMWRAGEDVVEVSGRGMTEADFVPAVANVRQGPAASVVPVLPAGFAPLYEGSWDGRRITDQVWRLGTGSFDLSILEGPAITLDWAAWRLPGAAAVDVRGARGLAGTDLEGTDTAVLAWVERPGALVTLSSFDLDVGRLREVAERLAPLDEEAWRKLTGPRARQPAGGLGTVVSSGDHNGVHWTASLLQRAGEKPAVCLETSVDRARFSSVCYQQEVGGTQLVGILVSPGMITAAVGLEVSEVRVVFADGSALTTRPTGQQAGLPMLFLMLLLPPEAEPVYAAALDATGGELSSVPIRAGRGLPAGHGLDRPTTPPPPATLSRP